MTLDTLIALIAILVAVYTLLPKEKQLDVRLRIGRQEIVYSMLCFVCTSILILIGRNNVAFFTTVISIMAFIIAFRYSSLDVSNLNLFYEYIIELKQKHQIFELIDLIDNHYDRLMEYDNDKQLPKKMKVVINRIFSLLVRKDIIKEISDLKPEFGLKIIQSRKFPPYKFDSLFFQNLLLTRGSQLQEGLINYTSSGRITDNSIILAFLFNDAQIAEQLGVWKPIGDAIINILDENYLLGEADKLNIGKELDEDEKNYSSIRLGFTFFDVMVRSALHQGIEWHMWLYYFPLFVKRIVRNYYPHPLFSHPDDEYPTIYYFFIDEIFNILIKWIRELEYLPLGQSNIQLRGVDTHHENGNIPKSSIIALSSCLPQIILSDKFSNNDVVKLLSKIFRLYFWLRDNDQLVDFSKVLALSIVSNKFIYNNNDNQRYIEKVIEVYEKHFDRIPYKYDHINEFREILNSYI